MLGSIGMRTIVRKESMMAASRLNSPLGPKTAVLYVVPFCLTIKLSTGK